MVINRGEMKRKRKDDFSSTLLDDSPKRTKVHAQRKFAQGSNVNSPVITPVKEIEKQDIDVLPEPVELLPIKRPNTEDFLTFLCFRGTPILPPSLNFFNTASIVDTNGQVHEIKSESPKNGPIDTTAITKSGAGSSERPFVAYGVRKRADPIVISRQMDKKRRHALTIQALRRKYQEQRMAKIRAVTISKLSEKVTNKTLIQRTNSVTKTEANVPKKSNNTIQKTKVVATKVTTRTTTTTVKTNLRPKIKPKMCLRSFRGRFVQRELQFRGGNLKKKVLPGKKTLLTKNASKKKGKATVTSSEGEEGGEGEEYSSDDDEPLLKTSTKPEPQPKVAKKTAPGPKKPIELNLRVTRSGKFLSNKLVTRRQQIKQRLLLTTPKTVVKPRTLRSQTMLTQKGKNLMDVKEKVLRLNQKTTRKYFKKETKVTKKKEKKVVESLNTKKMPVKKTTNESSSKKKETNRKSGAGEAVVVSKKDTSIKPNETTKKEVQKKDSIGGKAVMQTKKQEKRDEKQKSMEAVKPSQKNLKKLEDGNNKKEISTKTSQVESKKKLDESKKIVEDIKKDSDLKKKSSDQVTELKISTSQRPTRKTKEAAAIYMEILSHKLVNEDKIDDDNVSIDSFPELPNVKRMEQRENELKAKAKSTTIPKTNTDSTDNLVVFVESSKKVNLEEKKKGSLITKSNEGGVENKKGEKSSTVCQEKKTEKNIIEIVDSEDDNNLIKKTLSTNNKTVKEGEEKIVKTKEQTLKNVDSKVKVILKKDCTTTTDQGKNANKKLINKNEMKEILGKRKSNEKNKNYESTDSDNKIISNKIKKSEMKNKKTTTDIEITKRQTRNSSQNVNNNNNTKINESNDSDESFFVDIKISRKKPITRRSKNSKTNNKNLSEDEDEIKSNKKSIRTTSHRSYKEFSSSSSSTADINDSSDNSVILNNKIKNVKNKRFTKTKNQQLKINNVNESFSDSDEEPLSKLTIKQQNKIIKDNEKNNQKKELEIKLMNEVKPKRECAKIPQNYLPMFSSSDEDDEYFHGFVINKNEKNVNTNVKEIKDLVDNNLQQTTTTTTTDLLYKDVGRRFGKDKVNMTNEEIEKWLKDSAMAGNSIKKENDEMLKFGEKIIITNESDLIQKLNTNNDEMKQIDDGLILDLVNKNIKFPNPKPIDRKLIFRKEKINIIPNKNAFSANNESSVYAFGDDNDDIIMKTPFRRITRRPSSTATSKSEDEFIKFDNELINKLGPFRKPNSTSLINKSIRIDNNEDLNNETTTTQTENDESNSNLFYLPKLNLIKSNNNNKTLLFDQKSESSTTSSSMIPPSANSITVQNKKNLQIKQQQQQQKLNFDRFSETSEELLKYKIPSSPSASSSSSAKLYKRQQNSNTNNQTTTIKQKLRLNNTTDEMKLLDFPSNNKSQLVDAPTFYPNDKEFQDPLEYIEKIRLKAEQYGICRIIPPTIFKPECKVTDDMRFTAYNQYVHKMLHRWGPNFKELMAIKKYLSTQNINLNHPPWIGGMEVDLPRLYQTVQLLGGLKEVIEKKKWPKVSDLMKIPKFAQDRVTKLDDIYCKYLLPYDTLSLDEREKLFDEVETEWAKRESKTLLKIQQQQHEQEEQENQDNNSSNDTESDTYDEADECIVKGRNIALNAFYRIARNTMSMWFKSSEPSAEEVEQEFWKHVTLKQNHICVHSGSIDSGNWGYGFAVSKNSPFARHAWNLKVLTNNSGSVLRSLGPIMGVTVPTLHVGMVFSACCWYRDPHQLPWIEYLHTGGNKIWYGIPDSNSHLFQLAIKKLVPNYCQNKTLWLPSDTVMVPPNLLIENGVSLSRLVQEPGQFIVVFPKVFTSNLCTGYIVSESVYFATPNWLQTAKQVFNNLRICCESSMFSFERLLLNIVNDSRTSIEVLKQIIPLIKEICDNEIQLRKEIKLLGLINMEKLPLPDTSTARKRKKIQQKDDGDYECKVCRMNLFVSMITETQEDVIYCLSDAMKAINKKTIQIKNCKLMYTYDDEELSEMVNKIHSTIEYKLQKKIPNKFTGMPTLLNK